MRYLLLLSFVFPFALFSQQAGSIKGQVRNVKTNSPIAGVKIVFQKDSLSIDSVETDQEGNYYKTGLAALPHDLFVTKENYHSKYISQVIIQKNQVGRFNFYMEEGDSVAYTGSHAENGVVSPDGTPNRYIHSSIMGMDGMLNHNFMAVEVIQYAIPLIDKDGGSSGGTITREDISKMATRSVNAMASTVGGVYTDEQNNIISIRGSRADNVYYYIDGVRVRNPTGVHKSSISNMQVITGGLPANYGDVTGGVIVLETKSYMDYPRDLNYNYSSNNSNPMNYEKDPEPVKPFFDERFNTESYEMIYENEFLSPKHDPLSTFSIDVDKASYSNVRRFLNSGTNPSPGAVRTEELINYFNYDYEQPTNDHEPLAIHTELNYCPWNKEHQLLKVGMKGKEIKLEAAQRNNLVFLIDVSGSMSSNNKLPLLKKSFSLLVDKLHPEDKISMVVYAGSSGLVLEPTKCKNKEKILRALNQLESGGSTNGASGIKLAYKIANQQFIENGNNRVILATDGDFNVGTTSNDELENLIVEKRASNIFLTTLGFGMGNYKDDRMEMLANKGNGNYFYIDNLKEAKKALVQEMFGTIYTIAKDVKLQLEFNPKKVKSYRLIGYENRLLAAQDFNNDKKDAGELGSGHTVTALYEIIPAKAEEEVAAENIDPLKYQKVKTTMASNKNELVQVKCRYKMPTADTSQLKVYPVKMELNEPSMDFLFAASVAAYGMKLRDSEFISNYSWDELYQLANQNLGEDKNGYRSEFLELITKAERIYSKKSD